MVLPEVEEGALGDLEVEAGEATEEEEDMVTGSTSGIVGRG